LKASVICIVIKFLSFQAHHIEPYFTAPTFRGAWCDYALLADSFAVESINPV